MATTLCIGGKVNK